MSARPDKIFVLVHGSYHGAWAFGRLAPLLARQGHQVIARDLPGHGLRARFPRSYLNGGADRSALATESSPLAQVTLRDCAEWVAADLGQLADQLPDRRIVLVGHSFGGLVLNRVAESTPRLIDRLVYVSAFMTAAGRSINDYLAGPEFGSSELPPLLVGDPAATGAFRIDPRSADPSYRARLKTGLAADVPDDDWEAVAHQLTPDAPAPPHAEPVPLTAAGWGAIPRTYVSCTADRALPVATQHRFIREADALTPDNLTEVRELPTGHSPFFSRPEELAEILLGL
ncbi:alpha/beta hydrolase [Streptomyces sp. A7024]|uniref:Alpha/beta hydrolase n=1 Tax=Streptomyces coryli TaxID=1128680 RepID=A0A6G4UC29_9ACTN|nr:alpha/beta fold hydrolase [Streptomyces coryli]NGN68938.1 alpha/beta hydrolase [Streptomyces coryli]